MMPRFAPPAEKLEPKLTPRQVEAVEFLCRGLRPGEIAIRMKLSRSMVRKHLSTACERLGSASYVGLAIAFTLGKHGLERKVPNAHHNAVKTHGKLHTHEIKND
jgi:DNA-binding CsgD family transcriptional regulator